jgi:hypothetical protein
MKTVIFLLAAVVAALSLASFAGSARAGNPPVTNLQNMRHEMLKAVANNLRG